MAQQGIGSFLGDLKKVVGVGASFAALPFFLSLASLQPPWPPAIGPLSAALVFAAALASWEWTRRTRVKSRRRWIVGGMFIAIIGLGTYLYYYSGYIEEVGGTSSRVIRGTQCTSAAELVYKTACPDLPPDALPAANWNAYELWTRQSITRVRMSLTAGWLAFTMGLILMAGAIVAGRKV